MAAISVARYVSDSSANFKMRMSPQYADVPALVTATGAVSAQAADTAFHKQFKPRHVTMQAADGTRKVIICYTAAAPLYTGATTSLTINAVEYTRMESHGERRRGLMLKAVH